MGSLSERIVMFIQLGDAFRRAFLNGWKDLHPHLWQSNHVLQWLAGHFIPERQIDTSNFRMENFACISGASLAAMTKSDFSEIEPLHGQSVYESFHQLCENFGSLTDAEKKENLFHNEQEMVSSSAKQNSGRSGKGTHLWQFILELLKSSEFNPTLIKWEDKESGIFKFVNTKGVAYLWGKKRNRANMNYEKLSRALRHYYKKKILEPMNGRRLVYKFGPNATDWKAILNAAAPSVDTPLNSSIPITR